MLKINFIRKNYPLLFERLTKELPSGFFQSPETAEEYIKRKYNDIVYAYIIAESGDFKVFNFLQMVIAA